jgi:GT2 family glycosyltransferase
LIGNALSPTAVTVRRAKLEEVGGFREGPRYDTVEDYDLWMRLAKVCEFRFIEPALADYLLISGGASKRVAYHHSNLEALLRDHFAEYERRDAWTRLLMRRRLSQVSRAAARAFIAAGEAPAAKPYVVDMLKRFPLEPKNIAVALWWLLK